MVEQGSGFAVTAPGANECVGDVWGRLVYQQYQQMKPA